MDLLCDVGVHIAPFGRHAGTAPPRVPLVALAPAVVNPDLVRWVRAPGRVGKNPVGARSHHGSFRPASLLRLADPEAPLARRPFCSAPYRVLLAKSSAGPCCIIVRRRPSAPASWWPSGTWRARPSCPSSSDMRRVPERARHTEGNLKHWVPRCQPYSNWMPSPVGEPNARPKARRMIFPLTKPPRVTYLPVAAKWGILVNLTRSVV